MKKSVCILLVLISIMVLCLSGCSDFGFNPIGTWTFTKHKTYDSNGNLLLTVTSDEDELMKNATITFKKSGTGYIGSNGKNIQSFTYEYSDSTVTISYSDNRGQNVEVEYKVKDNGDSLVREHEYYQLDSKGNKVYLQEELIFSK